MRTSVRAERSETDPAAAGPRRGEGLRLKSIPFQSAEVWQSPNEGGRVAQRWRSQFELRRGEFDYPARQRNSAQPKATFGEPCARRDNPVRVAIDFEW